MALANKVGKGEAGVVRVVDGKWIPHRPFRSGIQVLRPNTAESVPVRLEVNSAAIRRPRRVAVQSRLAGDRDPVLPGDDSFPDWSDKDLADRRCGKTMEDNPAAVMTAPRFENLPFHQFDSLAGRDSQ